MNRPKIPLVPRQALIDLAREVTKVLAKQGDYFRSKRPSVLAECRDLERRLSDRVKTILDSPQTQPTLWVEDANPAFVSIAACAILDGLCERLTRPEVVKRGELIDQLRDLSRLLANSSPPAPSQGVAS